MPVCSTSHQRSRKHQIGPSEYLLFPEPEGRCQSKLPFFSINRKESSAELRVHETSRIISAGEIVFQRNRQSFHIWGNQQGESLNNHLQTRKSAGGMAGRLPGYSAINREAQHWPVWLSWVGIAQCAKRLQV